VGERGVEGGRAEGRRERVLEERRRRRRRRRNRGRFTMNFDITIQIMYDYCQYNPTVPPTSKFSRLCPTSRNLFQCPTKLNNLRLNK